MGRARSAFRHLFGMRRRNPRVEIAERRRRRTPRLFRRPLALAAYPSLAGGTSRSVGARQITLELGIDSPEFFAVLANRNGRRDRSSSRGFRGLAATSKSDRDKYQYCA